MKLLGGRKIPEKNIVSMKTALQLKREHFRKVKWVLNQQTENPLFSLLKILEDFLKLSKKEDPVIRQIRDAKICEW